MQTYPQRSLVTRIVARAALTALCSLAAWPFTAAAEENAWAPVFRDKKGVHPIDQASERYSDKDWLLLDFLPYTGLRPRVAIVPVCETSVLQGQASVTSGFPLISFMLPQVESTSLVGSGVPVGKIGNLLGSALLNTNRFDVVDRMELDKVMKEQGLGQSGLVTNVSAAQVGQMLGAQFLVVTSVDEWIPDFEKSNTRVGRASWLNAMGGGINRQKSLVAMTVKVIDASTGKLVFSESVTGTAKSSAFDFGGMNFGFGRVIAGMTATERKAPITQALMVALNKATYQIATGLKEKSWQGMVADVDAGQVYVNGGTAVGVTAGLELEVLSRGKEIRDPQTGVLLGYRFVPIGAVRVVDLFENMSAAQVLRGCKGVKVGDLLRIPGSAMGVNAGSY